MEYIKANGITYECQNVTTSADAISFTVEGHEIETIKDKFGAVTALTVSNSSGDVYGTYENLLFESATVFVDGSIKVVMHIPTEMELRVMALEAALEEHDELVSEILYGGDE